MRLLKYHKLLITIARHHAKMLLFFALCFVSEQLLAQSATDTMRLEVFLYDSFSEDRIPDAKVSVYAADGTTMLCDSMTSLYRIGITSYTTPEGEKKDTTITFSGYKGFFPKGTRYVVKVSVPGYDGREEIVDVPKKKSLKQFTKDIYLFKSTIKELGEASVTASKILMVNKGDTIVYNAAAFRMAEGSMLDNLVRALPGAQIDESGRITINGEFVSTLLVNGRDFFKGDPKVALSNLPAYAVNKIKVYHRNDSGGDNSKRSEEEKKRDPLVMDVNLKRQYSQGWLTNFETAGGAHLKGGADGIWLARLFAMRFTNHSTFAVYGNANNMNDYDAPASKGEWRKPQVGTGEKTTQMGGISFSVNGKKTKIQFSTELQAMHQTTDNEQRSNSVSYLTTGDVSSTSARLSHSGTSNLKWNASLDVPHDHVPAINLDAYYTHSTVADTSHTVQYEGSVEDMAYNAARLYERSQHGDATTNSYGGGISFKKYYKIGNENGPSQSLSYKAEARYDHQTYDGLRSDCVNYAAQDGENINELKDESLPTRDYTLILGAKYNVYKKNNYDLRFDFSYRFSQAFKSGSRSLLRLDQSTAEENDTLQTASFSPSVCSLSDGALPSMRTASAWLPDVKNSYHTTTFVRERSFDPEINIPLPLKFGVNFSPSFIVSNRRVTDDRGGQESEYRHNDLTFNPSASVGRDFNFGSLSFIYNHNETLPELGYLLNVRDDSDPLTLSIGNADLKKSQTNSFTLDLFQNARYRWRMTYELCGNAIAMARTYDRTTGTTTYQPQNINGNKKLRLNGWNMTPLDKKKRVYLTLEAQYEYNHNVDFSADNTEDILMRQAVDNNMAYGRLQLSCNLNKVRINAQSHVRWTRLTGDSPSFITTSYTEYDYGISLTAPIVWGIDLDTDLMVYSRRGYTDASMNTTEWVWNASLTKSFGRQKRWLIRVMGFDLLSQLANIRKVVNAQGRTETWYNTIPSYATLHIVYRLDIKPKK